MQRKTLIRNLMVESLFLRNFPFGPFSRFDSKNCIFLLSWRKIFPQKLFLQKYVRESLFIHPFCYPCQFECEENVSLFGISFQQNVVAP